MKSLIVLTIIAAFVSNEVIAQSDAVKKPTSPPINKEVCKGAFEVYVQCGPACEKKCSLFPDESKCPQVCVPGCYCQTGYLRNGDGRCIVERDCAKALECVAEGENQHWILKCVCENTCKGCPKGVKCKPVWGCSCKDGFSRTDEGKCIPADKCPIKCPKANQIYYECDSKCYQPSCDYPEVTYCRKPCVAGCFCKEGFVLDAKNNCIPLEQCKTPPKCNKESETYSLCGANGCQDTCENPTFSHVCKGRCIPGCICREGYLRNAKGKCIKKEDCPNKCKLEFEVYQECGPSCQKKCSDLFTKPVACVEKCTPGCFCQDGYVRDDNGRCIPADKCPIKCPNANQIYYKCDSKCYQPSCDFPEITLCLKKRCIPGCFCKEGFVLDANNNCIPLDQCKSPPKCDKESEEYSECTAIICQDTCDEPELSTYCKAPCSPGCICKYGYIRNAKSGKCIKREECSKCKLEFEVYQECGPSCQKKCSDLYTKPVACVEKCIPGCFCQDDYVRDDHGRCIPAEHCPEANKCLAEEIWSIKCHCDDICGGCPPRVQCRAGWGCHCRDGFLKDESGKCIPAKECPEISCSRPFTVFTECAPACPVTCKDVIENGPKYECTALCRPGCVCQDGYVIDNNSGECIPKEKCI